ncbi:MAG: transcription antitermination factor NusB [Chloroherpetonaceae bacterium]|nr:transcription antitermination factor NusB [Chloroherpetonaceae bacterium]
MVNRRQIREVVMQVLYAYELRKEDIKKVSEGLIPEEILSQPKSRDFALGLIEKVVSNLPVIDAKIKNHADNWELDRMAVIDKNLMRMAIAEMMYFPDVPPKVSINEAIEIAKRYSTDKSGRFVNGILDAVRIELKNNGELNKTGRGLIDMPPKHPKETHQPPVVVVNEPPPQIKEKQPPRAPSQPRKAQEQSGTRAKPSPKPNPNPNANRGDQRDADNRKR